MISCSGVCVVRCVLSCYFWVCSNQLTQNTHEEIHSDFAGHRSDGIRRLCCPETGVRRRDQGRGEKELTTREIVVIDIKSPTQKGQPRSAGATVDVYYVPGSGLEFYFNYLLGTVTIDVTDASGASIATRSCNTDSEPSVCLPVVLTTDNSYSIRIVGPDYEGVGTIL